MAITNNCFAMLSGVHGVNITDYKSIVPFAVSYEAVYEFAPELPVIDYIYDENNNGDFPVLVPLSAASYDYHKVLKLKMRRWAENAQVHTPFKYDVFADTGPLIDRAVGRLAGLGFYGRNTYLINNQFGALFFIGYLLSDLTPKQAHELVSVCTAKICDDGKAYVSSDDTRTGCPETCDICIKACPTGALNGKGLNKDRCISYLTQYKGELTTEQKRLISNHIYGCGICGSACIMNNGRADRFIKLSAKKVLNISNSEFKKTFGLTACGWRGAKLMRRNVNIALHNFNQDI